MRKLFVLFCYLVALLLFVSACGNNSDFTDSAVELGEEFIEELYNVDDLGFDLEDVDSMIAHQNEFSSFFTEDEFEDLSTNRFFLMPLEAANNQNSTISVENIAFVRYDRDQVEKDALDFEHSFNLLFIDQEGNEVDEIEMNGQMTVVDSKDGLKINRYHDSEIPIELLNP